MRTWTLRLRAAAPEKSRNIHMIVDDIPTYRIAVTLEWGGLL